MTWPQRKGIVLYQQIIMRGDLRANYEKALYVFGDNLAGYGYGGQAAEIRGQPNAIGIPTKRSPKVYLNDGDFDDVAPVIKEKVRKLRFFLSLADSIVVFPADGVGTGLAKLSSQAPKIWAFLCAELESIGIKNGGHHG